MVVPAEIARRLLAAGRAQEAWAAINAAATDRGGHIPFEWQETRLAVMEALGMAEEAQAFRWRCFEAFLDATHLRHYLKRLRGKSPGPLRHPSAALACAVSPDGRHIVSGDLDGLLRTWDIDTPNEVPRSVRGHGTQCGTVTFRPDGKRFAFTNTSDTRIDLYLGDVATGATRKIDAALNPLLGGCGWMRDGSYRWRRRREWRSVGFWQKVCRSSKSPRWRAASRWGWWSWGATGDRSAAWRRFSSAVRPKKSSARPVALC